MFFLAIIAAVLIRIYLIFRDSIPFAYDMGRDLLWAKDISFYHIPTLIGPAASIWGVYFGPFWFYFLSIPLLISSGNPVSAVYATSIIVILTGILAFWLFKKILGKTFAFILAIILFFSATLINISTFAFHANLLPLLTLLVIYFGFLAITKNPIFLSLAFLAASLMFHADPAPAVVFSSIVLFIFFYFKLYRSENLVKVVTWSVVAYIMPFIPQLLFEIRNNFIQTKSLIAYFRGENPSLSGQLPFLERILNLIILYFDIFKTSFAGENNIIAVFLVVLIIFGIYRFLKADKDNDLNVLLRINLILLIATFLLFTIPITVEVKNWYLWGLVVPMAFLIVLGLHGLKRSRFLIFSFLVTYLILNTIPFFENEKILKVRGDPATLSNQLQVIDVIYKNSRSNPFSVYVFTPPIYDLHWQYLFWWQGIRHNRGLPTEFAYSSGQPDYVRNKNNYAQEPKTSSLIYLIIEQGQENEYYTRENWLKNFDNYKVDWEKNINDAIRIQKRTI